MYKTIYAVLTVFWIFDIVDLPFMTKFDTTYPINTFVWTLIWLCLPGTCTTIKWLKGQ